MILGHFEADRESDSTDAAMPSQTLAASEGREGEVARRLSRGGRWPCEAEQRCKQRGTAGGGLRRAGCVRGSVCDVAVGVL